MPIALEDSLWAKYKIGPSFKVGVIVGACSVALQVFSAMFAVNAGVTADEAKAEWTAGILPGVTLLPSGVWGVNRAQEHRCTYVAGGG
jgi:hypothetical protein